ncbi:hypothetical protein LYNGBM3L_74110 [Moorena producens 3L]|uniref:Uncharacterized protein n=1 Tax=Moorena producens 3L TaxID=489825 RepID=F4Y3Y8_9CYAN|nr:hypothetical protein LYNGBM3L_74110 [Moorena producens 3L]
MRSMSVDESRQGSIDSGKRAIKLLISSDWVIPRLFPSVPIAFFQTQ